MQSLDTNILLRLVLRDDAQRANQFTELLIASKSNSFVVADAVFFEMVWVLSGPKYRYSRKDIGHALLLIIAIPQIISNRDLIKKAVPLYIEHTKLSFIDVCLTLYAEFQNATPLLTFDQPLAKTLRNAQLLPKTSVFNRPS